jgi:hypothetical protein
MRKKKSISLFFLFCLLNVALIPQLCINAVQTLNDEVTANAFPEEETEDLGINIFEEESKEGQEENKTGSDNFFKFLKLYANNKSVRILQLEFLENQEKLYFNDYSSIELTPLSPPPDQV